MTVEALIFDVDGTLAETEELHRRAFNEAFAAAGLGWTWDEELYTELLKTTGGKERIGAYMADHLGTAPDEEFVRALHAEKTARYAQLMEEGALSLRPGIFMLMNDARTLGLRLAVATTTSRANIDALCLAVFDAPASEVFEVIAAGDEAAEKKPAPDVYLLALERLGLPAAACIALEDSCNGVRSARAAGIPCIAVRAAYTRDDDLSEADAIRDSFTELSTVADLCAALEKSAP